MSTFTFDTAWIVAHMQNSNNQAQIAKARQFLANLRCADRARENFANFETYCWAWQNDCLALTKAWADGVRRRPAVNCWPYKRASTDTDWDRYRSGTADCYGDIADDYDS